MSSPQENKQTNKQVALQDSDRTTTQKRKPHSHSSSNKFNSSTASNVQKIKSELTFFKKKSIHLFFPLTFNKYPLYTTLISPRFCL